MDFGDIGQASNFLREAGYFSEFDKNNLVLVPMCACRKIQQVTYDVNIQKHTIFYTIYLNLFSLWFSKKKVFNQIKDLLSEGYPHFDFKIDFKHYGTYKRRKKSNKGSQQVS